LAVQIELGVCIGTVIPANPAQSITSSLRPAEALPFNIDWLTGADHVRD